ncbi:response regulator [Devosia sp. RR2S18]|uniref:response regulator n=1 Tax=Devosia rhizosphaerae TaxID=3049774 RepID=UPI00254149A8|nr:response regulator [Devosia sp. RR2S18]WIJ25888.1 response regulator [Devosia sp. RR2S18]
MESRDPTVLVVEDEYLLAMTLEEGLQDAGYAVVLASTGDAAIKLLETEPYRFIGLITDIRMPGSANGWEVARHARELRAGIPVVYASGEGALDWHRFGVTDSIMLSKPFEVDRAVECLELLVQAQWQHAGRSAGGNDRSPGH